MENQTKINITLILAMIASFVYVGEPGLEPNYYCEDRELTAYCYELSGTGYRCYTQENKAAWKNCASYWQEIPEQQDPDGKGYNKERCSSKGCTPI